MEKRYEFMCSLFVAAGLFLLVGVVQAKEAQTVKSEKPVDFYYQTGQEEILVPFGNVQACEVAYMGTEAGLVIDKVVTDGQEVKPMIIKGGVLDGPWDLMLEKPGESFRYQVRLGSLDSVTLGTPFGGKSFPVSENPPPRSVEVYYRIRCADGKLGAPHVTRGVRLDFDRGKLTTGTERKVQDSGDGSKKSATGRAAGGNKGAQTR